MTEDSRVGARNVPTEQRLFRWWITWAALLLLAIGYPMLLGRVYVEPLAGDFRSFHLPIRYFYAESLAQGHSFLWCPFEYMGFYLHGEGQFGLYHPLNLLQYGLLPLPVAFDLEILRNYFFLLTGTFLFLRRWRLRRDASMLGALLFTFSSFNILHFSHLNFVGIAAHIPWLLVGIDIAARSRSCRELALGCALVTLLTASQLMLGHPQVTWMAMVAEGLYAGFLLIPTMLGPSARRAEGAGKLMALAVALATAFLVAGIGLVPQWESLQDSYRIAPPQGFSDWAALLPVEGVQLVAPYLFPDRVSGRNLVDLFRAQLAPEHAFYAGAVAPVLLAWGLVRWRQLGTQRSLFGAAVALAILGFVLAMGERAGLYRLQQLLPVVGLFRIPGRYILLVLLGLALASAVAYADLLRAGTRSGRALGRGSWLLAVPVVMSLLVVLVFWGAPETGPPGIPQLTRLLAGPVLVSLATLLVVATARGSRAASLILPFFVAAEIGAYGLTWVHRFDVVEPEAWARAFPVPVEDGLRAHGGPTALVMRGVRLTGGYMAMPPRRELFGPGRSLDHVKRALRVASVGHAFGTPASSALPRARLVTRAVVGELGADLDSLDVARVALVSEPIELEEGPPGVARIAAERPGAIDVVARAPTRQLLVLSESHHPGWQARVDGKACDIVRVYGDLMGCVVERGAHRVRFRFEPASFRTGKWLSAAGLGLLALGLGLAFLRTRSA